MFTTNKWRTTIDKNREQSVSWVTQVTLKEVQILPNSNLVITEHIIILVVVYIYGKKTVVSQYSKPVILLQMDHFFKTNFLNITLCNEL